MITAFRLFVCLGILIAFTRGRLGALSAAPPPETVFQVGTARINITPDYPIRLTGYAARKTASQLPGLPLWAKALAIGSDADGPAILITVDNCGVCSNITEEVASRLQKKAGIAR